MPEALPGAPAFPPELRARLSAALARRPADFVPRSRHRLADGSPRYTNRLVLEASPYLQQHAHNPVNWYAWGEEAFEAARSLGRPLFVSIGYSTCHWCHVMEEESFDDPETAELLNAHFVAVKVDREARPDVDAVYMEAVQALGEGGGWPLNVWLTPDGRPFFGGTYFPPEDGRSRPGFRHVLRVLQQAWSEDPDEVERQAGALSGAIASRLTPAPATSTWLPPERLLLDALAAYWRGFDPDWGGLRGQPKFPATLPVGLLLRIHRRSGDTHALEMARMSLEKMGAGGLRDQLGGGFHRYATDSRWLVPHFEKMLYDQARLATAYLEGWQVTGREDFARIARETLDYVAREMTAPGGGFYSATDADSPAPDGEMQEGRYFTWTRGEVEAVLGAERAGVVCDWFGVGPPGEVEGRSVLRTWQGEDAVAAAHGLAPAALRQRLDRARAELLAARARRAAPARDEKIIAGWNGLMISAFARAALVLDEPRYDRAAVRAAEFVLGTRSEGRLRRLAKDGRAQGPAFLEDYAFLEAALLDLYEAVPEPRWIAEAVALQRVLDEHYAAGEDGAYFRSADDGERLLVREKPDRDGAVPAGNAVAALNLLRLAGYTGEERYRLRAFSIFSELQAGLAESPPASPELLAAVDFALDTPKEVLLVSPEGADAGPMLDVLRTRYVPNRVVSVVTEGAELEAHAALVPLLQYKRARDGRVTAYVCEDRVCRLPTTDPSVFAKQLAATKPLEAPKSDP